MVQKHGDLLHGNPYEPRKVVLSNQLLDRNELTPVTVVKNTEIIGRFLQEVRDASRRAGKENADVLLLVFCHGTQSSSLVLDHTNPSSGLTAVRLKEATGFNTRVTLITTACYSGGWAVNPDLNLTSLTAAGGPGRSDDKDKSESVGRCCGCMFASSVIATLTGKSTPLLDSQEETSMIPEELQPLQPSQVQTDTHNEFCRSIWDVCETRIFRLTDRLEFSFSAQDDAWDFSWTGRTGIPLSSFRERWERLPVYSYTGPADAKARLNPSFSESAAYPSRIGSAERASAERDIQGNLLKAMHEYKLVNMIDHFLETCPNNWDRSPEISLRAFLRNCKENKRATDPCLDNDDEDGHFYGPLDAFRILQFRMNIAAMVDYFVARFGLTLPYNQPCLLCDVDEWRHQWKRSMSAEDYAQEEKGIKEIWRRLYRGGFMINPDRSQGPEFGHAANYLSAAFAATDISLEEKLRIVDQILEFMNTKKQFFLDRAVEQCNVQISGRNWLQSLGRKAGKSLSPVKRGRKCMEKNLFEPPTEEGGSSGSKRQ